MIMDESKMRRYDAEFKRNAAAPAEEPERTVRGASLGISQGSHIKWHKIRQPFAGAISQGRRLSCLNFKARLKNDSLELIAKHGEMPMQRLKNKFVGS